MRRKRRKTRRRIVGGVYFLGPNKKKTSAQNEASFEKYKEYMKKKGETVKYDCNFLYPGEYNFNRDPIPVSKLGRGPYDCGRTEMEKKFWQGHRDITDKKITEEQWNKIKDEEEKFFHPQGALGPLRVPKD